VAVHAAASVAFGHNPVAVAADLDEAQEVLSRAFLPSQFECRAGAAFDVQLNVIKVGQITAGYLRFGDAVRVRTVEASNYHIDIPVAGAASMRSGLRDPVHTDTTTAAVFMPGLPADLDCDRDFAQLCLMLPCAELQLELENLLGHDVHRPLEFSTALDLNSDHGRSLLGTLRLVDLESRRTSGLLDHALAASRLEQLILFSVLLGQPHNYSDALARPAMAAAARPVADAVELIRACPEHPWTVGQLASRVSVSVRALQAGFRRSLGTPPMTYLRHTRLDRVHHQLKAAPRGSVAVGAVAAHWGFTHMGRFATEYRHRFGERPSDTLEHG
jgi:AraC-like DNA-binding protein